jgi:hypothetical protein
MRRSAWRLVALGIQVSSNIGCYHRTNGLLRHNVRVALARPSKRDLTATYRRLRSVPALADELGVAYETARRWLVDAGVELQGKGRPSTKARALDVKALVKRYRAGESIATLGAAFGVSPETVRTRLIEAGVTLRPRRGWTY